MPPASALLSAMSNQTTKASPIDSAGVVRCYVHELEAARRVSNTSNNPNRAFFCCSKDRNDPECCDFFFWEDLLLPTKTDSTVPSSQEDRTSTAVPGSLPGQSSQGTTNKRSHQTSPPFASSSLAKKSRLDAIQAALTPQKEGSRSEYGINAGKGQAPSSGANTAWNGRQMGPTPPPSTPSRSHGVSSSQLSPSKRLRLAEIEKALGTFQAFSPSPSSSNHTSFILASDDDVDERAPGWSSKATGPLTPPSSQALLTPSQPSSSHRTPNTERLAAIERGLTLRSGNDEDDPFSAPGSVSQPQKFSLPRISQPCDDPVDSQQLTSATSYSHPVLSRHPDPTADLVSSPAVEPPNDPLEAMINNFRQHLRNIESQKTAKEKSNIAKSKRIAELEEENQK
ncbi:hypothetical protein D9758_001931 [Tetrapyrgos nigripes]|uniref:GRF-type domain-containing protein n=1 Tax=Tetrapyrgos nigripes TaxID=182062 RepID=A0A8H5GSV2_9AGAR|nr:hypothetical protein D9758_001931 [Tetrapyrgos nigripes]